MPAEWAPHDAVWTAWPYAADQWAEGLDAPRAAMAEMMREILDLDGGVRRGERVELLIRQEDLAGARALLGDAGDHVRFHHVPYGDIWLRDTGPIFLSAPGQLVAACFGFDGWGGKYVMPGDDTVSATVAAKSGVPAIHHAFVLEGGAIDVDGAGTVLTTRQCLLDGGRRGAPGQAVLDRELRVALGVEHVVWLDRGLANDHTDGHVDTIARFVAPGVVVCMEPAPSDPNRDALAAIIADLRGARTAGGVPLEVVTVPSPGTVLDAAGNLMPASYTNFYIGNRVVVVPTYGVADDDRAVARIAALFPGRRTVAVDGKPVVVGGGGFHCATQQQPSPV